MASQPRARSPLSRLHHWLEGRPLGHPLHPLFAHLPIGLFTLSFLFDVASRVGSPPAWLAAAAFYTLVAGLVTALVASLFGVVDWVDIRADHPARRTANLHMLLNLAALALYLVNGWLRLGQLAAAQTALFPLFLSFVSLAVLYVSGYLGGRLVYDEGLAVGRHRRQSELPEATLTVAGTRPPGEFVPVASIQRLDQHATLRLSINGCELALVRVGDDVYAVQDYCTHRFAPLSDGCLSGAELECPWHRSRFDVRTGAVTQGPARLALRTYATRVVDGVIHVRVPAAPGQAERYAGAEEPRPEQQPAEA